MAESNIPPGRTPAPPGSGVAYVGPRYKGPKKGYIYDPRRDYYYPDPKFTASLTGEKPPGLLSQLGPVAAVGGTTLLANQVAKDFYPEIKGLWSENIYQPAKDAFRGLLGLDPTDATGKVIKEIATPGATQATQNVVNTLPTNVPASSGLLSQNVGGFGSINPAPGSYPVRSLFDGGVEFSDGSILPGGAPPVYDQAGNLIAAELPASQGGFGLGSGSYLGDILAPLAIAHGGYNLASQFGGDRDVRGGAMSGAEAGAGIGTLIAPGVGTLVGAGLGAIGGGLLGSVQSGRSGSHEERSNQRQLLKDTVPNFLDESGNITLSSGEKFDIGKERESGREYYQGLFSAATPEEQNMSIGYAQPLGAIMSGGNRQVGTNFAGNIAAGFTTAGDTEADFAREAKNQYDRLGISEKEAYNLLSDLAQKGTITQEELPAYHNAVYQTFHGNKGLLAA